MASKEEREEARQHEIEEYARRLAAEAPPLTPEQIATITRIFRAGREDAERKARPANYLAPDGYRYGVMFNDGSVAENWNGKTQRARALTAANAWARRYAPDNITLARRRPNEPWERV